MMTVFMTGDSMLLWCCHNWSEKLWQLRRMPCPMVSREYPFKRHWKSCLLALVSVVLPYC